MWLCIVLSLLIIEKCTSISSPIQPLANYKHSAELENNLADLYWTIDDNEREIIIELHVKTTGWIALGISPGGGMKGADIGVGWIDNHGKVHFQDRYASDFIRPTIDNTTNDWFALQGRELNGWTAIQFKRLLDTCDSMDYPIKTGTNILIYAYDLNDPDQSEINYHENRRGTRMIPLRSYSQPPSDETFSGLDYFDLRLNNYIVPSSDTTYYCKIYKAPTNYETKRHAIAYKVLIEKENVDLVHHLVLFECNPSLIFNDNNLPNGVCDDITDKIQSCLANIATTWAIGGDHTVEFAEEAGYPVGNKSPNKYFMIQMHYDNPRQNSNRRDSSGIRFYLGNKLRQYDLGYLTFGTTADPYAIAIPPKVENFIVDSYCSSIATRNIPKSGITVLSAFPHTHLQGIHISTKLIRNKTAIEYLFNAESYNFNYQFENRLTKRIKLYPGDEFATRCVYNTMNKDKITLGGEPTKDEMCAHIFTYYPRMADDDLSTCFTMNTVESLQEKINSSSKFDNNVAKQWLLDFKWTPELSKQWQEYYNTAPRMTVFTRGGKFESEILGILPKYEDLKPIQCEKK